MKADQTGSPASWDAKELHDAAQADDGTVTIHPPESYFERSDPALDDSQAELLVGKVPGRKSTALSLRTGGEVIVLAYFTSEEAAERYMRLNQGGQA